MKRLSVANWKLTLAAGELRRQFEPHELLRLVDRWREAAIQTEFWNRFGGVEEGVELMIASKERLAEAVCAEAVRWGTKLLPQKT